MHRYSMMILAFLGVALSLCQGAEAGTSDFEKAVRRTDAAAARQAEAPAEGVPMWLVGTWALVRCDSVYPDGRLAEPYGTHPQGLWMVDAQGRYMMQIDRAALEAFASPDGSSVAMAGRAAHRDIGADYGWIRADSAQLHTHIASTPLLSRMNADEDMFYQPEGDLLTYSASAQLNGAPSGTREVVVWRRLNH